MSKGENMSENQVSELSAKQEYKDEYKVGHNKPPLFLLVLYILVIIWCSISWIPFYGY